MTEFILTGVGLLLGGALGSWATRRRAGRLMDALAHRIDEGASLSETGWQAADRLAHAMDDHRQGLVDLLEEREAEHQTLRRVLRSVPDPVLLVGDGGVILFANVAAWRVLGDSLDPQGKLLHHRLLEVVRTAGSEARTQVLDKLEHQRTYLATTTRDHDGTVLVVLRNITEEQRVSEMRRDFVADASHELKTPVAAIQAASETVLNALADSDLESARRFAAQASESAVRLSRIVSDLLDLSRLETHQGSFDVVDVGVLLADVASHLTGPPTPLVLAPTDPIMLYGSEPDLRLAFSNLLGNAIRHTPEDGSVRVRLIAESDHIEIRVSDTGEGIPSKHLDRIFERFYRVDSARARHTGGTGLGLSIVRHVIAQHGGTVQVESVLGEGATFRVMLPLPSPEPTLTSIPQNEHFPEPRVDPE